MKELLEMAFLLFLATQAAIAILVATIALWGLIIALIF